MRLGSFTRRHAIWVTLVALCACDEKVPDICGAIMSSPGTPDVCVPQSTKAVTALSLKEVKINQSPYGRSGRDLQPPYSLFEGESARVMVVPAVKANNGSDGQLLPICYAARTGAPGNDLVDVGGAVLLWAGGWTPLDEPDVAIELQCSGGRIRGTSADKAQALHDGTIPYQATACEPNPPTSQDVSDARQACPVNGVASGQTLFFQAGVHGQEAAAGVPFNQASTPAFQFLCGPCPLTCDGVSCGGPDGCNGKCGCGQAFRCQGGQCVRKQGCCQVNKNGYCCCNNTCAFCDECGKSLNEKHIESACGRCEQTYSACRAKCKQRDKRCLDDCGDAVCSCWSVLACVERNRCPVYEKAVRGVNATLQKVLKR